MADDSHSNSGSNSDGVVKRLSDETQPGVQSDPQTAQTAADGASSASPTGSGAEEAAALLAKSRNDFLYLYAEFEKVSR